MNAITPIEIEGIVERFDDLGVLEEGWQATSKADIREEEETRLSVGRVRRAFWIAAFILLLLNSVGLVQLVQGLSIGPVQDTVIVMTQTWNSEMERHGMTRVLATIRAEVAEFVKRPWDQANNEATIENDVLDLRLSVLSTEPSDRAALLRGPVRDHTRSDRSSPDLSGS